jgi:hypothetical protein
VECRYAPTAPCLAHWTGGSRQGAESVVILQPPPQGLLGYRYSAVAGLYTDQAHTNPADVYKWVVSSVFTLMLEPITDCRNVWHRCAQEIDGPPSCQGHRPC